MSNFLDKLNTLVKASVSNLIDEAGNKVPRIPSARLGANIDSEIAALRKQIDLALNEQDEIKAAIDDLQRQIDQLDGQIDHALQNGDEANARYLSAQMQQAQRRQSIMSADLEEHKRSTSDFIQRVSTLESMVADARREQEEKRSQAAQATQSPVDESAVPQAAPLSDMLREARERVQQMINGASAAVVSATTPASDQPAVKIKITNEDAPASQPTNTTPETAKPVASQLVPIKIPITPAAETPSTPALASAPVDNDEIEADLAKRRSRLSNPDKPKGA
jgi:phage shock protein A